jgi:hypothetical protein
MLKGSIEEFCELVKKFQRNDFDWFHLNTGVERSGKTTLAFRMCYGIDKKFNIDNVVFTAEDFRRVAASNKKRSAIMIDEGAVALFSRESMKYEVRELIKVLTVLGHKNHFVVINIPDITLIDSYVRTFRCRSISRIKLIYNPKTLIPIRGQAFIYGRRRARLIRKGRTGNIQWVSPTAVINFKKITKADGNLYKIWQQYYKISKEFKGKIERGVKYGTKEKLEKAVKAIMRNPSKYITTYNGRSTLDEDKIAVIHTLGYKLARRAKKTAMVRGISI